MKRNLQEKNSCARQNDPFDPSSERRKAQRECTSRRHVNYKESAG